MQMLVKIRLKISLLSCPFICSVIFYLWNNSSKGILPQLSACLCGAQGYKVVTSTMCCCTERKKKSFVAQGCLFKNLLYIWKGSVCTMLSSLAIHKEQCSHKVCCCFLKQSASPSWGGGGRVNYVGWWSYEPLIYSSFIGGWIASSVLCLRNLDH